MCATQLEHDPLRQLAGRLRPWYEAASYTLAPARGRVACERAPRRA